MSRAPLQIGVVAVATALGWAALLAGMPSAIVWLCGENGLAASVQPWDLGRLLELLAMWIAMMAAMALPCAAIAMVFEPVRRGRLADHLVELALIGAAAAVLHWGLASVDAQGSALAAVALLLSVLALELRKWTLSHPSRLLAPLQMVCLQLVGDPMSGGWMLAVLLWMIADALMPERSIVLSRLAAVLPRGARPSHTPAWVPAFFRD